MRGRVQRRQDVRGMNAERVDEGLVMRRSLFVVEMASSAEEASMTGSMERDETAASSTTFEASASAKLPWTLVLCFPKSISSLFWRSISFSCRSL